MAKAKVSKKTTKRSRERKYPHAPSDAAIEKGARVVSKIIEDVWNSAVARKLRRTRD